MSEANGERVVLVCGAASSLGEAVALEMSRHGLRVALHDEAAGAPRLAEIRAAVRILGGDAEVLSGETAPRAIVAEVTELFGRLDFLINLYLPDPAVDDAVRVASYPVRLLERCQAAGDAMAAAGGGGAIVNQACLPSMYADTSLQHALPLLRNGLTGVTRSACLAYAAAGVRVSWIQTGFLEMPEMRSFASARVRDTVVPIGRWSTPEEFAKLTAFVALRATYLTGQGVILDGGLTAGNAGT